MKRWLIYGVVSALFGAALTTGCHIEINEDDKKNKGDDDAHEDAEELCPDFCGKLIACEGLSWSEYDTCEAVCFSSFDVEPERTRAGLECVEDSPCYPDNNYPCSGAPLPE